MTNQRHRHPIGIFDSGIGGLTVAQAIVKSMPKENIIYFGDTAHLPYGDKSTASIQAYAIKIAQMLLQQHCKVILIACNSASAAAFDLVKEYVGSKSLVMNVIDPVVQVLQKDYKNKKIGLIGTRQTVNSHIYKKKIDALNTGIDLISYATNLLAAAIEEFGDHSVLDGLLHQYLTHPDLRNIDALVLACTHYPIVKNRIATLYEQHVQIIDSAEAVAKALKTKLTQNDLLNDNGSSQKHFYVSDYTESFAQNAKLFFNEEILLEHYPLWD